MTSEANDTLPSTGDALLEVAKALDDLQAAMKVLFAISVSERDFSASEQTALGEVNLTLNNLCEAMRMIDAHSRAPH